MAIEEMSILINAILCVLSFVLAVISVITVILTLKQNGKMIRISNAQISEMRKEHELSLQPVLSFSNPVFFIEKPRLFYSPPESEYSIQSRFGFEIEVKNLSSAVAVYIICSGTIKANDETYDSCSKQINILAGSPEKLHFMFLEQKRGEVFSSLREENTNKLLQCEVEVVFRNTTGGAFRMKKHYIVNPKEETIGEIKKWHSIVASAEVEYKEELNRLRASHGKDHVLFCKLREEINKKEENENRININCVELDKFFVYESISIDEYTKVKGQKSFPTFIGFNQKECIANQDPL